MPKMNDKLRVAATEIHGVLFEDQFTFPEIMNLLAHMWCFYVDGFVIRDDEFDNVLNHCDDLKNEIAKIRIQKQVKLVVKEIVRDV